MLQQYNTQKDNMVFYLALRRKAISKLKSLSITQFLREKNAKADQLARVPSSIETELERMRVEYPLNLTLHTQTVYRFVSQSSDLIVTFLSTKEFPLDKIDARRIRY